MISLVMGTIMRARAYFTDHRNLAGQAGLLRRLQCAVLSSVCPDRWHGHHPLNLGGAHEACTPSKRECRDDMLTHTLQIISNR